MKLKKKERLNIKHKIALFLVYFVLFSTLSAIIDYYAYDFINPWVFLALSAIGSVLATLAHAKSREKTKADELANNIERL